MSHDEWKHTDGVAGRCRVITGIEIEEMDTKANSGQEWVCVIKEANVRRELQR
jgi:hypothetical protein